VLHACNNKGCVHPHHLQWGTKQQNRAAWALMDATTKGSSNNVAAPKKKVVDTSGWDTGMHAQLKDNLADSFSKVLKI
jgi:hypothetical protein